jgi:hypothetical protein
MYLPLQALDYFCAPNVSTSDHKPVAAVYSIPTIWQRHNSSAEGLQGIQLCLTNVHAEGLFILRKSRGKAAATNSFPSPSLCLMVRAPFCSCAFHPLL